MCPGNDLTPCWQNPLNASHTVCVLGRTVIPWHAWPSSCQECLAPTGTGQLGVVPDVTQIPPRRQWWRRGAPSSVWASFWAGVSSLYIGTSQLVGFGGPGREDRWLRLALGGFFTLVGLVNLLSALRLHRNRRRLANSATKDANSRL